MSVCTCSTPVPPLPPSEKCSPTNVREHENVREHVVREHFVHENFIHEQNVRERKCEVEV